MPRALERLQQAGQSVIPKLIEALEDTQHRANAIVALVKFVDDNTLPIFLSALRNASPVVIEGLLEVLQHTETYDPNRLISLFANPRIPGSKLEQLFLNRKAALKPQAVLQALPTTPKNNQTAILKLINQIVQEDTVSELLSHLKTDDLTIRLNIVRILCRFRTSLVQESLLNLLSDPHHQLRLLALEGLVAMNTTFNTETLCRLMCDPEPAIQQHALDILLRLLRDETETVRQKIVEGLNAVGNANIVKHLLTALKHENWEVSRRTAEAIGLYGRPKLIEAVLRLFHEQDKYLNRCAFEAIYALKDGQALQALAFSLQDKDLRDRSISALVALGDKRMIPLFMRLLECDEDAAVIAARILATLNEPQAIPTILMKLSSPNKTIIQEALRALAVLTNADYAPEVLKAVMATRDNEVEEIKELANKTATAIIKRFGRKVLPHSLPDQTIEQLPTSRQVTTRPSQAPTVTTLSPVVNNNQTHITIDCESIEPGIVLADRYRVIRRIGEGGFSSVFLVDDTMVSEEVILKILNPQIAAGDDMIKRFIQELRYARKVTHENVIRIHDIITLGRSYAISMEYFPSHTLAHELQGSTILSLKRGVKIIFDVCRGIGAAHQVDIVHRDLKPLNILINDQGMVKVVDFGVAAVTSNAGTRLTRVGTLLGTPAYVAPEQVRSRAIDARTDIYSLGVVMYEVFTGKTPYDGDDMSILFQHVEGNLIPPCQVNPDIPSTLDGIIRKAMDVDPDRRFQSMDELRKNLVAFSRQLT